MPIFAATVFLGAFLLFLVEPLIGKALLPWFGGTPNVWSSCLLFFQVTLFCGYLYSHVLVSRLEKNRQLWVHLGLLAAALATLAAQALGWGAPLLPGASLKPPDSLYPIGRVLRLLALTVGPTFLVLSTTGPLLQAWYARAFPSGATYRLYALSNVGSFVALLGYPFAVEPALTLRAQSWLWVGGFLLFAAGVVACAAAARFGSPGEPGRAPLPTRDPKAQASAPPTALELLLWTALAACPSIMLLSVTTQLSQEVAVSPFLWVLPLSVYLLSFILCFESDRWYSRRRFLPAVSALLVAGFVIAMRQRNLAIGWQIGGLLAILFVTSMFCHGELARRRPAPEHLTRFYLALALGGAIGGLLVPLLAPLLFRDYFELDASFVLTWVLAGVVLALDQRSALHGRLARLARFGYAFELAVLVFLVALRSNFWETSLLTSQRNFYGLLRVYRVCDPSVPDKPAPDCATIEMHGCTNHGKQISNAADPARQRQPTTYFTENAGVGRAITSHPKRLEGAPMRVGIIGLGAGTLASYGLKGDLLRFYEINPAVVELARAGSPYFTFLSDTPARVEMVLGDARLSLERELREGHPGRFDVLIVDAFSSDSIPAHLLTREALEVYRAHLSGPDSILAIHVSNVVLDLVPLVWTLAEASGLACRHIESLPSKSAISELAADWMLLSPSAATLDVAGITKKGDGVRERRARARLWTDDYTNVLAAIR
jgi:hypothetical protein